MKNPIIFSKSYRINNQGSKWFQGICYLPALIILFFTLAFHSLTFAQISTIQVPPEMKMNATPNPVGSGARALGIGGAFISIADDATAASWNPAALLNLKRPEISIVGSCFAGRGKYNTSLVSGEINDLFNGQSHLNYFSAAYPFNFLSRNMVFSLNYQHLYEFSQNKSYQWIKSIEEASTNIEKACRIKQKGALSTLSPALGIQVVPFLYIGVTTNFWINGFSNNYWENIKTVHGGDQKVLGAKKKTFAELYERYDFSGFNTHIGFLWRINRSLSLGGVVKSPFKADITYKYHYISIGEYPENMAQNEYISIPGTERFKLKMPLSYGIGTSIRFSDTYLMSLDVYRTEWGDFLMCTPSGNISPINNKLENEADIKPTIQVRLGVEYIVVHPTPIISTRFGIFYDPEPAGGSVDDFYGASIGTGIVIKNFAFDIAYQYRFGHKAKADTLLGNDISSDVKQHYIYTSVTLYF